MAQIIININDADNNGFFQSYNLALGYKINNLIYIIPSKCGISTFNKTGVTLTSFQSTTWMLQVIDFKALICSQHSTTIMLTIQV